MHKKHNPASIAGPFGKYSHAVEGASGLRWLHISGQVGVTPDGKTQSGFQAQAKAAFDNIKALLREAGMDSQDIVKIGIFIVNPDNVADFRAARDEAMGADFNVASTLLVVSRLASPEWLIEIEAIAAKA